MLKSNKIVQSSLEHPQASVMGFTEAVPSMDNRIICHISYTSTSQREQVREPKHLKIPQTQSDLSHRERCTSLKSRQNSHGKHEDLIQARLKNKHSSTLHSPSRIANKKIKIDGEKKKLATVAHCVTVFQSNDHCDTPNALIQMHWAHPFLELLAFHLS